MGAAIAKTTSAHHEISQRAEKCFIMALYCQGDCMKDQIAKPNTFPR